MRAPLPDELLKVPHRRDVPFARLTALGLGGLCRWLFEPGTEDEAQAFVRTCAREAIDLAENRAERGILMKMEDWAKFLDSFLELSSYPVLEEKGHVSALEAKLKAEQEYEVFRKRQDAEYVSDFDREVKRLTNKKKGKA